MKEKSIFDIINEFDTLKEKYSEMKIASAIRKLPKAVFQSKAPEIIAESMAFEFRPEYKEEKTGWGTYYGPMMVRGNKDGTVTEYPSIRRITNEMINYWEKRSQESNHSILKSRYADLVWDFSKKITGKQCHYKIAHTVIDNIVAIADLDLHEYENDVVTKLKRALSIAISINDQIRIENVINVMIAYEEKKAGENKPIHIGFCYDYLVKNKKVVLSDEQQLKIINDLESRLTKLAKRSEEGKHDPITTEEVAIRLADYYKRLNKIKEVKRVLTYFEKAYVKACDSASALLASSWLQTVHATYIKYGLKDEADKIAIKLREIGPKIKDELKPLSSAVHIKKEEMDQYVAALVEGSLDEAISRVAYHFIPKKNEVENQMKKLYEKHPISFFVPKQLQDHRGRPVAFIGSLEDDLTGNIIFQISQNFQISSIFLRNVLNAFISKFNIDRDFFIQLLYRSPIFDENKKEIISAGYQAYLDNNHLVAIHLLIPQIEDAIRNLVEISGDSVYKLNRIGGIQLKIFDELLREPIVVNIIGDDMSLYFRVLYTDPRGLNIRNDVCHGISPNDFFSYTISDRIIHSLLCLSLIRKKK